MCRTDSCTSTLLDLCKLFLHFSQKNNYNKMFSALRNSISNKDNVEPNTTTPNLQLDTLLLLSTLIVIHFELIFLIRLCSISSVGEEIRRFPLISSFIRTV